MVGQVVPPHRLSALAVIHDLTILRFFSLILLLYLPPNISYCKGVASPVLSLAEVPLLLLYYIAISVNTFIVLTFFPGYFLWFFINQHF